MSTKEVAVMYVRRVRTPLWMAGDVGTTRSLPLWAADHLITMGYAELAPVKKPRKKSGKEHSNEVADQGPDSSVH